MKKIIAILLSTAITFAASASAFAEVIEEYSDNEQVTFIVEMEGDPVLGLEAAEDVGAEFVNSREGIAYEREIEKEQTQAIRSLTREHGSDIELGHTYTVSFNGFSVKAPYGAKEDIEKIDGVKNVYVARVFELRVNSAAEQTNSLVTDTAIGDNAGYTGEGQAIAIIDSGFQLDHEFFATAPENPVIKSDLANSIREGAYYSEKIPFAYNYAGELSAIGTNAEHGTHVAGIAAGKNGTMPDSIVKEDGTPVGTISGVAPEAQLVLMKAGNGGIDEAAVIAAVEDAIELGVCAINMSFGVSHTSPIVRGGFEESVNNAKNAGIMVNVAAGNDSIGYNGEYISVENPDYYSAGTPDTHTNATSIASVNNSKKLFEVGTMVMADDTKIQYRKAFSESTFPAKFAGQTLEYADCGYGYASDFTGKDLEGKLALIKRGELDFTVKSDNAKNAGAVGFILYDPANMSTDTVELSLPAVIISYDDGLKLIEAEDKSLKIEGLKNAQKQNPTGGEVSVFSSWGVTETLELKPEISAPGAYIMSSYPGASKKAYAQMQGTSMAAPHMTGVSAIMNEYLQRNEIDLTNAEKVTRIENMLMSAADIIYQPDSTVPYSPRVQGAGLVNTANAIKSPVILVGDSGKSKISLGEITTTLELPITLQNISGEPVTYTRADISVDVIADDYEATAEGNMFTGESRALKNTVTDIPESITVPAGGTYDLTITVTLDEEEMADNLEIFKNGFFVDGFVKLNNSTDPEISIPFTGFYGGWAKMSVFDKTMYDEGGSVLDGEWARTLTGTFLWTTENSSGTETKVYIGVSPDGEYDKNRIAISPDGDGMADKLGVNFTLMRSTKNIKFLLTKNDDSSVQIGGNLSGAYPKYSSRTVEMNNIPNLSEEQLPDGKYTLTTYGTFCYDGAEEKSFSLPVIVDRAAPVITYVDISDNTLTVKARDTHYVDYMAMIYTDSNGEQKGEALSFNIGEGEEATATFDISGIDRDSIIIAAEDEAMNVSEALLANATGAVIASLTDYSTLSGMTSATVAVTNSGTSDILGDAIIAFYDNIGRLITMNTIPDVTLTAGASDSYMFRMLEDTSKAKEIRMFIWGDLQKPLDTSKIFKVN